jgi:GNAT superfamily N-acetyltransferase
MLFEQKKGNYLLSTDKTKLDIDLIHHFLAHESYWAKGVARSKVEASIDGSLCFGVYLDGKQIGFARAVTDYTTVAYIADVFVLEAYRGQGLGKWIIEGILKYPAFQDLRRIMLLTATAQKFYAQYGFITTEAHKLYDYMEKVNPKRFET